MQLTPTPETKFSHKKSFGNCLGVSYSIYIQHCLQPERLNRPCDCSVPCVRRIPVVRLIATCTRESGDYNISSTERCILFAECDENCASGCVVQGGGRCDDTCESGYSLSYLGLTAYQCLGKFIEGIITSSWNRF